MEVNNTMSSEIKRRKNESFEAYMRRVKRTWQRSGKLLQAKKIKFFSRKPSKGVRKKSALHKLNKASKIAYLQKVGRMPMDQPRFGRRRR